MRVFRRRIRCALLFFGALSMAAGSTGVSGADMTATVSLVPQATVGVAQKGDITCKNTGSRAALNATCGVTGLPMGLALGACVPSVPVASLAVGASVICPISGNPNRPGNYSVTALTGADNDGVLSNNFAVAVVTVTGANRAPLAANDTVAVNCVSAAVTEFNPLANDSDPDGDPIYVTGFTPLSAPGAGTVSFRGAAGFSFISTGIKFTSANFSYIISDAKQATATGTVTLGCK